jgi:hypothetical protein
MIDHTDENRIIVLDGDDADRAFRAAMEGKQEALTELLNEHDDSKPCGECIGCENPDECEPVYGNTLTGDVP